MRTWIVEMLVKGHGTIEVEADTEEEALAKAEAEGGFEISNVAELTEFEAVSAEPDE